MPTAAAINLFIAVTIAASGGVATVDAAFPETLIDGSALAAARALVAPQPTLIKGAEFEGAEFWEEHDELLTKAWEELGPRHSALYSFGPAFEKRYVHHELRKAAAMARAKENEVAIKDLFQEVIPGVFASDRLFTKHFLGDLLGELEHIEGSGIPRRRPNGMNRYGVILNNVGFQMALDGFVEAYARPLAATLFPETVNAEDAEENYAFTVRYEATGDTELAKHGDASVVTLNLCLGQPGWEGGKLRFFEYEGSGMYALPRGNNVSAGAGDMDFEPGLAIMHRGQHKHQALPLLSGERTNVILWLMGMDGVVRVKPYLEHEQLTVYERWHWPKRSNTSADRGFLEF